MNTKMNSEHKEKPNNIAFMTAHKRMMENKAGKSELEVLRLWASAEVKEWSVFLELIEGKLKNQ